MTGGDINGCTENSGCGRWKPYEKAGKRLSDKEKLERAEARIKLLESENELLKKNELIEMGILTDIKSISNLKQ